MILFASKMLPRISYSVFRLQRSHHKNQPNPIMVAAVSSSPAQIPIETSTVGTVARKRRRQILQSQRQVKEEDIESPPDSKKQCIEPALDLDSDGAGTTPSPPSMVLSARKISDATASPVASSAETETKANAKKPQMRYDPEVPMTKEEAALWRREQRRKRNRESAAASRQRQRDRIEELEEELDGWKDKFEVAMERLEKLEELYGRGGQSSPSNTKPELVTSADQEDSAPVSPCPSTDLDLTPPQTLSATFGQNCKETEHVGAKLEEQKKDNEQHLKKKNSLPAQ